MKILVRKNTPKEINDQIKKNKSWLRAEQLAVVSMPAMLRIRYEFERWQKVVIADQNLKWRGIFMTSSGFVWMPGFLESSMQITPISERQPFDLVVETGLTLKEVVDIPFIPSIQIFSQTWKGFAENIYQKRNRLAIRRDLWQNEEQNEELARSDNLTENDDDVIYLDV